MHFLKIKIEPSKAHLGKVGKAYTNSLYWLTAQPTVKRVIYKSKSDVDGMTTFVTSRHDDVIGDIVVNSSKRTTKKNENWILDKGSNNQIGRWWQRKMFSARTKSPYSVKIYVVPNKLYFINVLNLNIQTRRSVGYLISNHHKLFFSSLEPNI